MKREEFFYQILFVSTHSTEPFPALTGERALSVNLCKVPLENKRQTEMFYTP